MKVTKKDAAMESYILMEDEKFSSAFSVRGAEKFVYVFPDVVARAQKNWLYLL